MILDLNETGSELKIPEYLGLITGERIMTNLTLSLTSRWEKSSSTVEVDSSKFFENPPRLISSIMTIVCLLGFPLYIEK